MAAKPRNPKPVEISIIIRKFEEVLAGGKPITEFILQLTRRDPRVVIKGDVILVKAPRTTLRFTIVNSAKDEVHFFPTGITFLREVLEKTARDPGCETSEEERLGLLNFPQKKLRFDRQTLSITDNYRDGKQSIRYKFSVLIQRGSDGKIGLIDPAIVHDNSDLRAS